MRANGAGVTLGFDHRLGLVGLGQGLNTLALDFGRLQDGGDQLLLAAQDFGLLHLHLLLLFRLLDLDRLDDHLLLHHIGLDLVSLVGLCLLAFDQFIVGRFFHIEIALRFGLPRHRGGLSRDPLLIGLRLGDRGFSQRNRALDRSVAICLSRGHVRVALDPDYVRTAHVRDVVVLVANFLDGKRDHFKAHLVDVVGASGTHAIGNHLGLLDDLFDGELTYDAA